MNKIIIAIFLNGLAVIMLPVEKSNLPALLFMLASLFMMLSIFFTNNEKES